MENSLCDAWRTSRIGRSSFRAIVDSGFQALESRIRVIACLDALEGFILRCFFIIVSIAAIEGGDLDYDIETSRFIIRSAAAGEILDIHDQYLGIYRWAAEGLTL